MLMVNRQQVLGALKATGSSDADVLFAAKEALLALPRQLRLMALVPMVVGILVSLTVIGAVIGIPMLLAGWWLRRRMSRTVAEADATYRAYLASTSADQSSPAAVGGGAHALR